MNKGNLLHVSDSLGYFSKEAYPHIDSLVLSSYEGGQWEDYLLYSDKIFSVLSIFENRCSPALVELIKSDNFAFESIVHLIKGDPTFDEEGRYCLPREVSLEKKEVLDEN